MKERIKIGEIKPIGWLRQELVENMEGCIGHLDQLVPHLILYHDIYGTDRLKKGDKLRDLGRNDNSAPESEGFEAQFFWWNSETQSNWRDGFIRSAILLEEPKYLEQTRDYLEHIWSTQEEGYLGIYDRELRFQCEGENGELWAQSSLLRGLLACYEGLGDEDILRKICLAADCIMKGYSKEYSHPFRLREPFAGVGHGLTVVDSFAWLYEITKEREYLDYAVWLYEEYSAYPQSEEDLQITNVSNPFYFFHGHAVHTFEHIRALIIAAWGKPEYEKLLEEAIQKIPYYLTPSGAPIGDEWIVGRTADATETGYEFCTVHELLHTYSLLAERTGNFEWNERIEWLYFNAAEGMKHPTDSSIMYLKADNCYTADEYQHPEKSQWNPRYKYSPTHQDAAVCCVPNSGRITPYFIQSLLHPAEDGYAVAGYGPYIYRGTYGTVPVEITQETEYPFEMQTVLHIKTEKPVEFTLYIRIPSWVKRVSVDGKTYENPENKCQKLSLKRVWSKDVVTVAFQLEINFHRDFRGDTYVTYGPLLFALPLPSQEKIVKELKVSGFLEKTYHSIDRGLERLKIENEDHRSFTFQKNPLKNGWEALEISGLFTAENEKKRLTMTPMARTILRKVTF